MSFEKFAKQHGQPLSVARHDCVFRQGDQDGMLYFVISGLLKAYYVSFEGKESIKSFIQAGSTIGSLSATYKGLPCTFSLMALEDTQLIRLPFKELVDATHNSHAIAEEVIQILLTLSMRKEQREYEFLSLPAEERYLNLCKRDPELVTRLTQNDIARYLGITPVALSRIKKRLL
ncbi:MAG: Crp/Fnr family transcriptional regulator [Candidatus Thiodiazotropha lotti]|nr:Crp/Fnr family transcriptional regulator [Candidatus Thiodiazotropha lotti]MCG7932229.1 Crp/Fnr family transcriptional regulator [Candidatus Thiodiazotropha lotti]MCG8004543.1 Crp/Fnr family transcriptional regulator [Candidatus Thiodiazotropha lotti]MCG8008902.1 Crp/Fnr family transcriptional regulator [Candidatus Thiodiazotropha lotti]MCG8021982.1 Crp/Fnr family transcriptional regulator [Candidatus Thiodiazotropha lotti]